MDATLVALSGGFAAILTPGTLYYIFIGSLIGTLIGVLPGIGPLAALSLLLPATVALPPWPPSPCSRPSSTARCMVARSPPSW